MKFKFKFELQQTNSMHEHVCKKNIKPLINFRKTNNVFVFSYTIFPVKKINVGKFFKLRENQCWEIF
jgi:hypothetical protein